MLATVAQPRKPRVLLVDDQRPLLHVLGELLTEHDMQVVGMAEDGTEVLDAIAAATADHGGVDVVVMDEKMPYMNGIEATRKLREQYPTLAVILFTAYAGMLGDAPARAGVNAEISKAGDPQTLIDMLRAIVGM